MRAIAYDRYGDASVLAVREMPDPVPRAGEVLVKVAFATLNPIDYKLRGGIARLICKPSLPAIPGVDFAGAIVAVGPRAGGFEIGQRVFGSPPSLASGGTCAELVCVKITGIARTPESVADDVAACLPTAAGTALEALTIHAHVAKGCRVLVTGASGAVGAAAVQIGRSLDADITGVCSTPNVAYVEGIGAQRVIDYKQKAWADEEATYDVIFDAAASSSWGEAEPKLAPRGVYITTMPRAGEFARDAFTRIFRGKRMVAQLVKKDVALLGRVAELAASGVVKPRIARTIDLDGVADAQRAMEAGRVFGKVCVRPGQ